MDILIKTYPLTWLVTHPTAKATMVYTGKFIYPKVYHPFKMPFSQKHEA